MIDYSRVNSSKYGASVYEYTVNENGEYRHTRVRLSLSYPGGEEETGGWTSRSRYDELFLIARPSGKQTALKFFLRKHFPATFVRQFYIPPRSHYARREKNLFRGIETNSLGNHDVPLLSVSFAEFISRAYKMNDYKW